jgi:L-asparaginase II
MARAFLRFEEQEAGDRVAAAMRAWPELIRGPRAPDSVLMRERPGWIAKGGADGVMCAARPGELALALKVEDGSARAVGPALAAFLGVLGEPLAALGDGSEMNSRGERVCEIVMEQ